MTEYILGLDFGQAATQSASCLLERFEEAGPEEKRVARYRCRGLKRWPLGTSYPKILAAVADMIRDSPLRGGVLILGTTVVGRPVAELFHQAKLGVQIDSVVVNAGHEETDFAGEHRVPKVNLISGVQLLLQSRQLHFAQGMSETPVLLKELLNYRFKAPPAPNEIYDPRDGQHDDLVLALALGCWWGEKRKLPFQWW
jgi:hypothetical protein